MANVLLVHGAFQGGWCWTGMAQNLRRTGHSVLAPDLPGAGEDLTPLEEVTLELATQRVLERSYTFDGPAVLVGYSMGGVITG